MPLLSLDELKVYYSTKEGDVKAVDKVSLEVEKGEAMGFAGESGCGKTTSALAITRLLPPNAKILGHVKFDGQDLTTMAEETLRKEIRWKRISLVFQGAMNAFNPVIRVGDQIVEAITLHEDVSVPEAHNRAEELFKQVGLDPARIEHYSFEFSGGMRQRAMIAMAIACNPDLLIADEPSTALDVIVAAQTLELLRTLRKELGISMILISHDLSILAETCSRVAIMYAGQIMEYGDIGPVFTSPAHPYTQGLLGAFPSIRAERSRHLISIPGYPPDLISPPTGCPFHPRCPFAAKLCMEERPDLTILPDGRKVACHLVAGRI